MKKGTKVARLRAGPIMLSTDVIISVRRPRHSAKPIPTHIKADWKLKESYESVMRLPMIP